MAQLMKEQGENNALFRLIRQRGLAREFPLIVSTLRAFSKGEIRIEAGKIFDTQRKPIAGYNLSNEVNEMVGVK